MSETKMTLAYMEMRMEYFKDKKVTDLTDEELEEFMQLRRRAREIVNTVKNMWNAIYQEVRKGMDNHETRGD